MKIVKKILTLTIILSTIITAWYTSINSVFAESIKPIVLLDPSINDPKEIEEFIQTYYPENISTVSELEYLNFINKTPVSELIDMGMPMKDIQKIKNNSFSKDLLKLAKESDTQLYNKGYNKDQIKAIHNYDGTSNAINYAIQYSLSNAYVTCGFAPTANTTTRKCDIFYYASWNQAPIFCITDIIGIAWVGADSDSHYLAMKIDSMSATGWYYASSTPDPNYRFSRDLSTRSYGDYINTVIPMEYRLNDIHNPCLYIYGNVQISTQSNSYNLYTTKIHMTYGHGILAIGTPKISFSISTKVNFGISTDLSYQLQNLYDHEQTIRWDLVPVY